MCRHLILLAERDPFDSKLSGRQLMEGSKDKATGKVREIKGRLTGNRAEEAHGIGEQAKGE